MEFAKRNESNFVVTPDREHEQRFSIDGHSMWVSDIVDMLRTMVEDAAELQKELFAGSDPNDDDFAFPNHIVDRFATNYTGYSFVTETENHIDNQALVRRAYLTLGRFTDDGRHVFDHALCIKWAASYWKLIQLESAICHFDGGLPPHGTEQVLSTITQTAGRSRTLHVLSNHQVCDIGSYHKTIQTAGGG